MGGSSQIRDWARVPCTGRWILNHWTKRGAWSSMFLSCRSSLVVSTEIFLQLTCVCKVCSQMPGSTLGLSGPDQGKAVSVFGCCVGKHVYLTILKSELFYMLIKYSTYWNNWSLGKEYLSSQIRYLLLIYIFCYGSMIVLRHCVRLCCTTKWIGCVCTYIPSL